MKGFLVMPITRILLFVLVCLIGYSAYVRYEIAVEMEERRDVVEAEVQELELQKRILEQKVEYLSNERGIEAELRRQFDVTLPGEEVIVILDEEASSVEPIASTTEKHRPWYVFWE